MVDVANNWTIVIGIATIYSVVFVWVNQAYLSSIKSNKKEVLKQTDKDLRLVLEKSSEYLEKKEEAELVNHLYKIVKLRDLVRESHLIYTNRLIPLGITNIILTIAIVTFWNVAPTPLPSITVMFIMLLAVVALIDVNTLRENENTLTKYLDGSKPEELIQD